MGLASKFSGDNRSSTGASPLSDTAIALEKLRTRLLDLTMMNRLLNFKQSGARVIRVIDELPDQLFERLLAGAELEFVPVPEPPLGHALSASSEGSEKSSRTASAIAYATELGLSTSFDLPVPSSGAASAKHADSAIQTLLFPPELEKGLRAIASDARSALDEKGSNILYMVFGFLEWYEAESSDKAIWSPLVMLPVSIRRGDPDKKTGAYRFFISYSDDDVLSNISLQEKLRRDFRVSLPDLEDEEPPEAYMARIATTVPLLPRWRIRRQISLGLLAFSKLFMYRDLDPQAWPAGRGPLDHARTSDLLGAGDRIAEGSDAEHSQEYDFEGEDKGPIPKVIPPTVMDADSSQHSALVDVFAGKSLVIEGPPGTGKSQTIANLIAAAMDAGRTVLFVAEKLTALEVVRRRLDEIGLGIFCLELHSDKTQKSRLMDDLKKRLDLRRTFRPPPELEARTRVVTSLKRRLNTYARRMNVRIGVMGWTVHDVLWGVQRRRTALGGQADLWEKATFPGADTLTLSAYDDLRRSASVFGQALAQVRIGGALSNHPFWGVWSRRTDQAFEAAFLGALSRLQRATENAITCLDIIATEAGVACNADPEVLRALAARADLIHEAARSAIMTGAASLATGAERQEFHAWLEDLDSYLALRARFDKAIVDGQLRTDLAAVHPSSFDWLVPTTPLVEVAKVGERATAAVSDLRTGATFVRKFAVLVGVDFPCTPATFRASRQIVACAGRAPFDLLSSRVAPDDGVQAAVESAAVHAASLRAERTKLEEKFDLGLLPDASLLAKGAQICASASFLSFLSAEYRASKRLYATLQRQPGKTTNSEMAEGFRALAGYVRKHTAFDDDAELRQALGARFRGLETRFDKIEAACAWQNEAVGIQGRHRLPGLGRTWLAEAPVEVIRDLGALAEESSLLPTDVTVSLREVLSMRADAGDVDDSPLYILDQKLDETLRSLEPLRALALRATGKGPSTIEDLRDASDTALSLNTMHQRLGASSVAQRALGRLFGGASTPPHVGHATLAYATAVFDPETPELLRGYLLRRPSPDFHERIAPMFANAHDALRAMQSEDDGLRMVGEIERYAWYGTVTGGETTPKDILERTIRALAERHSLPSWAAYLRARNALFQAGGDFVREVAERNEHCDLSTLALAVELVIQSALARQNFASEPELANHDGVEHTSLRDEFRRHDEELLRLERSRIAAQIDSRPVPEGVRAPLVKNLTDLALLEHELRKQRAHVPIRQLVNRAGPALRALKPCFMMSPRSIAQYLEAGKHSFDLVVMDEASQLRPEDALGAVVRGSQIIVVGDSKQLPPTSFFSADATGDADANPDEQPDETIADHKESILDLARTVLPNVRRLRWHYRSRHDSLIAFSNDQFYDGNLIVFPSPHEISDHLGVRLVHVENASYADGTNLAEAKAVVDAVMEHLHDRPNETLGVVALNIRQKALIQETLYDRFKTEPELRSRFERTGLTDEGFVKNLESVQGDERDVIMISVTYGPSIPGGRVARRFGPINADNGWRRLNVLFTRAKHKVVVFASFLPEQLSDDNLSAGAKHLRDYIAFARAGRYQQGHATAREPDSDFEVEVANIVRDAGYSVTPQVGVAGYFIDLAVRSHRGDGRYLLGVECDGAPYHSSFSARDRDRLRQQVLEGLGWKIHRIWSTDWYRDVRTHARRLVDAVRAAESQA